MNVDILWSVDDDNSPINGIAGVTDVVAATYNTIYLLKNAKKLISVKDNESANRALKKFSEGLLVGESTEPGLEFYCSNSPVEIAKHNWYGKTVIQKTNNGTVAVAETIDRGASLVFGFHWANIVTVAEWLLKAKLPNFHDKLSLSLIACGGREDIFKKVKKHLLEDYYCCLALRELIEGKKVDYQKYFQLSKKSIKEQYPKGDPTKATRDLVLQEDTLSGIVPKFIRIDDGIFRVENAIDYSRL